MVTVLLSARHSEWMQGACRAGMDGVTPPAKSAIEQPRRSITHLMNRNVAFASALAAALTSATGVAQTAGAPASAASAPAATAPAATAPAPVAPQAIPAKIAVIEYEQVAAATNEGQRA